MDVKITCIIPTLNRSRVLCDTIRMLETQSYGAYEIIVVDQTAKHDSTTEQALRAWHERHSIIRIYQNAPNASKARNTGAVAASGEVLLFLDDDIQIEPGFIAAHARNYLDPMVVAVAGQVLEAAKMVTLELQHPPADPHIGWIRFPKNYGKGCIASWMASGNFSVRKAAYFEVGGMDENYKRGAFREETDFAMRFLEAGYRFQFDPAASVVHLGILAVPRGGARSWRDPFEWHHYIGDWYFTLRFANRKNVCQLLWSSFRHLIASRRKIQRPWLMLISVTTWVFALPVALLIRLRGAKLAVSPNPIIRREA